MQKKGFKNSLIILLMSYYFLHIFLNSIVLRKSVVLITSMITHNTLFSFQFAKASSILNQFQSPQWKAQDKTQRSKTFRRSLYYIIKRDMQKNERLPTHAFFA